jgi:uncharacterized membrane protein
MLTAKRVLTAVIGLLGVVLVVYGIMGWPHLLSIQLIAGVLLIVYAVIRWRYYL